MRCLQALSARLSSSSTGSSGRGESLASPTATSADFIARQDLCKYKCDLACIGERWNVFRHVGPRRDRRRLRDGGVH